MRTTVGPGRPRGREPPLVGAGCHRPRPAHGHPRHDHREHRPAVRPDRAAHVGREPAVGHHRLHPGLRGPAAARRPDRRPRRPPSRLHDGPVGLRRRVRAGRSRGQLRNAVRGARPPGRVRGAARARRPVAAHHDVHRSQGARQGLRRVRSDRRSGRGDRTPRGRPPHPVPGLALVSVRQRAHRPRRVRGRLGAARRRRPLRGRAPRRAGRAARIRRHALAGTASRRRSRGVGATDWSSGCWPPASSCSSCSRCGRPGPGCRCCRCRW